MRFYLLRIDSSNYERFTLGWRGLRYEYAGVGNKFSWWKLKRRLGVA